LVSCPLVKPTSRIAADSDVNSEAKLTHQLLFQEEKGVPHCFVHDQLGIHQDNAEKGIANDFTLDDIRGAAAAIHIAGNNTVSISLPPAPCATATPCMLT
jgi:hypothetical protein